MINTTLNELLNFCREETCFGALLLTGGWGCGKTYLIDEELAKTLRESKEAVVVRVSLFGLTSSKEIHDAVQKGFMNAVIQDKGFDKASNFMLALKNKLSAFDDIMPKRLQKVALIDVSKLFEISEMVDGKRTILVFDDLERCKTDLVDVFGVINEYCENKRIRTIVVANQEKILENNQKNLRKTQDDNQLQAIESIDYSAIKEKIIQRTICYQSTGEEIVHSVLGSLKYGRSDYEQFVKENENSLAELLSRKSGFINIRNFKCAVSDYFRVYMMLDYVGIENQKTWFINFISYFMVVREGTLSDESKDKSNSSSDIGIPIYNNEGGIGSDFQSKDLWNGLKNWIINGIWDENWIMTAAQTLRIKEKRLDTFDIIRTSEFADLDEDVIKSGWGSYLVKAYQGHLSLDEYVLLIRNSYSFRNYGYILPEDIDWDKIRLGITLRIQTMEKNVREFANSTNGNRENEGEIGEEKARCTITPENRDKFTDEEWRTFSIIRDYRENNELEYYKNRIDYIKLMESDPMTVYSLCKEKGYDAFTIEMAEAVGHAFDSLFNAEKHMFVSQFKVMWSDIDFQNKYKETRSGFEKLEDILQELLLEYKKEEKTIAVLHTTEMLKVVKDMLNKLNVEISKDGEQIR